MDQQTTTKTQNNLSYNSYEMMQRNKKKNACRQTGIPSYFTKFFINQTEFKDNQILLLFPSMINPLNFIPDEILLMKFCCA